MQLPVLIAPMLLAGCVYGPGEPQLVHLEEHEIEMRPNRDDVTISAATLIVRCIKKPPTGETQAACEDFGVDGVDVEGTHEYLELEELNENRFGLPALDIEYTSDRGGYLCLALKLSLAEVPNSCDSDFYEERGDRYAIVSYCTVDAHPSWAEPHIYDFNRVEGLRALGEALDAGFDVLLKDGPLPELRDPDDSSSGCAAGE